MSYYQSQLEDGVKFTEAEDRLLVVKPSTERKGVLINDEQLKFLTTKNRQAVELLKFDKLVGQFRFVVQQFPDNRTGQNSTYSMEDAALSAFSVFFMQSPSFLEVSKANGAEQRPK